MILFMFIKGINPKTKLKKGMWNYGSKTYENFDYRGRTAAGRLHRRGAAAEGL